MVRRAIPFGSIPKRAVDELITESLTGNCLISKASKKRAKPQGMMIFPVKAAILFNESKMRELSGLRVLASNISFAA